MRNNYRLFVLTGVFIASSVFSSQTLAAESEKQGFDYSDFAEALKINVDDSGMVNYKKLKAEPQKLRAFITELGNLDRKDFEKWSDNEKIAFWLNAYNALTLKAIIDNYPIKSSFFKSRIYPKNSIRQIAGVWDKINFKSSSTTRRIVSLPIPPNSKSSVPMTEYTCHQYSSGLPLISSKSMVPKRALAGITKRNLQY